MFSGIIDWWYWYWERVFFYIVLLVLIICMGTCVYEVKNAPPRTEQTKILAVGELIGIRSTGSFCIYDTELKFDDGSMLCVTYSFSRANNLRVGMRYKIWDSSFYGYRCKLLKEK